MEQTLSLPTPVRQAAATQVFGVMLLAGLTALGAQIEVPHQPVPYTMQTFFVLLSGAMLGWRNGAISQGLYLLGGALGAPVFSHWGAGAGHLLGPTGGYLLAFPAAAFVVGFILGTRREFLRSIVAMASGLFVIFTLGTLQLNLVYMHSWPDALRGGFVIFSWWDALKLVAAAAIVSAASPIGRPSR